MRAWTFVKTFVFPAVLVNFIGLFLYMYYLSPPVNWPVLALGTIGFSVVSFFSMKKVEKFIREKEETKK